MAFTPVLVELVDSEGKPVPDSGRLITSAGDLNSALYSEGYVQSEDQSGIDEYVAQRDEIIAEGAKVKAQAEEKAIVSSETLVDHAPELSEEDKGKLSEPSAEEPDEPAEKPGTDEKPKTQARGKGAVASKESSDSETAGKATDADGHTVPTA